MKAKDIRLKFFNETGVTWTNSQEEPDIDYVYWLENKLLYLLSNKESEEEKGRGLKLPNRITKTSKP